MQSQFPRMPVLARASSIASIVHDLNQAQEAQVCTAKSQQTKDVHHGPLFHIIPHQ